MLSLAEIANVSEISGFKNDICIVRYYNKQSETNYFNFINPNGEFYLNQ